MKFKKVSESLKQRIKNFRSINKVLIVSTAILVLILGISVIYFSAKDMNTKEAADELVQFSQNIRRHYQNRPDFWGLSTQTIIDKKIAPQTMNASEGLHHFFGGEVLVGSGIEGIVLMPGDRTYDIVYKGLNKQQCQKLVSFKFGEEFFMGLSSVQIITPNKQEVFTWNDSVNKLPVSAASAKKVCDKENIIIWHFE